MFDGVLSVHFVMPIWFNVNIQEQSVIAHACHGHTVVVSINPVKG